MSRPPFALTHLESWRTYTKRLRDGDAVRVMALDHVTFEHAWPGFGAGASVMRQVAR